MSGKLVAAGEEVKSRLRIKMLADHHPVELAQALKESCKSLGISVTIVMLDKSETTLRSVDRLQHGERMVETLHRIARALDRPLPCPDRLKSSTEEVVEGTRVGEKTCPH